MRTAALLALALHSGAVFASAEMIRAHPIGPLNALFTTDDYPAGPLRSGVSGTTVYLLTIAPDGAVAECTVTATSGSAELDATTCDLLTRRARFEPARDEDGQPIAGSYSGRMTWQIPNGFPVIPNSVLIEFDVAADGKVENCQTRAVPDMPEAHQACSNIKEVTFPDAAQATKAPPPRRHVTFRTEVIIRDIPDKGGK